MSFPHRAVLGAFALSIASCTTKDQPSAPPVFGGQGAVVAAPKEMPLPPAEPTADPAGPCSAVAASDVALLDDFEDGDSKLFKGFQREGWWFVATDNTEGSKVRPPAGKFEPERLPKDKASKDNLFAAHFSAEGQKEWGVVWGTTLRWVKEGVRCPLNASSFGGIRFRAKGPGRITVKFGTPATTPAEGDGACKQKCYDFHAKLVILSDRWDAYEVHFDRVQQGGWGTDARFDSSRLMSLNFAAGPKDLPVDFWVDDIEFLPLPAAGASALTDHARDK
jgi:hypothetical protein